ncbi:MAG: membrane integrity-associated transporter subunit PqiC [Gemmatimonadaceae bacterium]|nr:membrane integrity-associated transporter subunit PqiC [Gemmatimonadaceae bacterium]
MRPAVTRVALAIVLLGLAVSGCFRLARRSPAVKSYVLGGANFGETAGAHSDSSRVALGLRRLDLAPYLSTLGIVVRRADNEIITTGFHRWAEGPSVGVNRAVAGYLAMAPEVRSVDVAPWPIRSTHDYLIQLHVSRLEGIESEVGALRGESRLLARWEIVRPSDGALVGRGVTDARERDWVVDDYAGLVARLDRGLAAVARDIVSCIGRVDSTKTVDCSMR